MMMYYLISRSLNLFKEKTLANIMGLMGLYQLRGQKGLMIFY